MTADNGGLAIENAHAPSWWAPVEIVFTIFNGAPYGWLGPKKKGANAGVRPHLRLSYNACDELPTGRPMTHAPAFSLLGYLRSQNEIILPIV